MNLQSSPAPRPLACRRGLAALALALSWQAASAVTAWGDKDDGDVLHETRTYHAMFSTERAAARARARLTGKQGPALLAAFKAMARAESRDPGSAPSGGDLGVVREGEMVRSFENALFALPPGVVSEPVKSEFGWHLILASQVKETPVAQVCATTYADAMAAADGAGRAALDDAARLRPGPDFVSAVGERLGGDWGPPLKDWNGDLAYVQVLPPAGDGAPMRALLHLEYMKAVLSTAPMGCRRSVRMEYEIDCSAGVATPVGRYEYEGRLATGRVLFQFRPDEAERRRLASGTGFHGQLVGLACRPRAGAV